MLALGRIAHKEGGGVQGMRNVIHIALPCIAMGEPWCAYGQGAKHVKYSYTVRGFDERLKRVWP